MSEFFDFFFPCGLTVSFENKINHVIKLFRFLKNKNLRYIFFTRDKMYYFTLINLFIPFTKRDNAFLFDILSYIKNSFQRQSEKQMDCKILITMHCTKISSKIILKKECHLNNILMGAVPINFGFSHKMLVFYFYYYFFSLVE